MANHIEITIYHTNDLHGRTDNILRIGSLLRERRKRLQQEGRMVFYLDAGDAADRRFPLTGISKGSVFPVLLNAMGCSAQTVGNAISLPYGPQALESVARRADYPLLAANFRDGDGPLVPGVHEHTTYPLGAGLYMGVFGLTSPWGGAYEIFDYRFPDMFQVINQQITAMREQHASPLIFLSHLGIDDDRLVADRFPEIDLIIGAHSHTLLESGQWRNGVLIAQAGEYGQYLGEVSLKVDGKTGRVLDKKCRVLAVEAGIQRDPGVMAALQQAETEIDTLKQKPIGILLEELDCEQLKECEVGDLAADAIRARMATEVAILSGGMFNQPLPEGEVTLGHLDACCFSSANPGTTRVTGARIREALERGLDPEINRFYPPSYRGSPVGFPQISGMTVEYGPPDHQGRRVRSILVGPAPLKDDGVYTLAHTDAETYPGFGYLQLGNSQETEYEVPTILREVIADYIQANSPVGRPPGGRWVRTG